MKQSRDTSERETTPDRTPASSRSGSENTPRPPHPDRRGYGSTAALTCLISGIVVMTVFAAGSFTKAAAAVGVAAALSALLIVRSRRAFLSPDGLRRALPGVDLAFVLLIAFLALSVIPLPLPVSAMYGKAFH